jgi:inosine-uridine nucleoside N-ribohydrolase
MTDVKVREVIVMGGTLIIPGNVTPVAGGSTCFFG